jgi:O-antigen/teichoic acid export membrane protein
MAFVLNVVAIVLAARFLGVSDYGTFNTLLAAISILSKFVDFGIEPIVFREFSKTKDSFDLFNSALNLRFLLYIVLVIGFNIIAPFINYSPRAIILSNIMFTTIPLSMKMVNIRELLATPFKVNLKMHYPMTLSILDNFLLLLMILAVPFVKDAILYFVIAYSLSNLPGFILSFYFLKKKFGYKYQITLNKGIWLLKESLPMLGYVILNTIFVQIDIIILHNYWKPFDVGIYSAASRLTMPLSIIPAAIVTTVFPILVKKLSDNNDTKFITNMVIKLLYFLAFIMAAVFTFESQAIVKLLFGIEYVSSAYAASILYWCQIFLFFGFYSLSVLLADNKQQYYFIYSIIQVVVNLGLCFLFIPKYSFVGAAIAKLIASFVSFVFVLLALNKFGFRPSIGRYRALLWSTIMIGVLYLLSYLPVIPYLLLSVPIIIVITIFTGIFSRAEIQVFFRLIDREQWFSKFEKRLFK